MEISGASPVLVVTADDALLDHMLAVCAAAGVEPDVVADPGAARSGWHRLSLVLIGADQAEATVRSELPRRGHLLLVDVAGGRDLSTASMRLGAPVAVLPIGAPELVATVAAAAGRAAGRSRVIGVAGSSGGVGVSTIAAALAFVGARAGHSSVLLDADPLGAGIDLLVGAESAPGWRWPRLARARGQLGDLAGQLPRIDGVDLVAIGRGAGAREPSDEAATAVVGALARTHDLVVVDGGRALPGLQSTALSLADAVLLVVSADVRGVACGRDTLIRLDRALPADDRTRFLVVRRTRAGGLAPATIADGVDLPVAAVVDDDPGLALAAERAEPPARSTRSQLSRVCRELLAAVVWGSSERVA